VSCGYGIGRGDGSRWSTRTKELVHKVHRMSLENNRVENWVECPYVPFTASRSDGRVVWRGFSEVAELRKRGKRPSRSWTDIPGIHENQPYSCFCWCWWASEFKSLILGITSTALFHLALVQLCNVSHETDSERAKKFARPLGASLIAMGLLVLGIGEKWSKAGKVGTRGC